MPSIPNAKIEKFVSDSDENLHLGHVWFDAESQRLAATDGAIMVVARSMTLEGDETGFIPVLAFETMRKMIARHIKESDFPWDKLITMKAFREQIIIANEWTHEVYTIQRPTFSDALRFPKFDQVIPKVSGVATLTLNRGYLKQLCSDLGGDFPGISIWTEGPDKQALVSVGDSDAVAIVMPMRYETPAKEILAKVSPLAVEPPVQVAAT